MNAVKSKVRTDSAPPASIMLRDASGNCVLAKGTKIEGNINSNENIRLDGAVTGEVRCSQKLVMGGEGRLKGTLFAKEAVVMGMVEGDVNIEGTLHLTESANIRGNIKAKHFVVDEGAIYNGECKVG